MRLLPYGKRKVGIGQSEIRLRSGQGSLKGLFGDAVFEQSKGHFDRGVTKAQRWIHIYVLS
jgi:hypothetical protein